LCRRSIWATEAALTLATLTYNLTVLFQRHRGWRTKVTIHSLRVWLFSTRASSPFRPEKPRSSSPCHPANATGGRAFGGKSSVRFPTAMQSKIAPSFTLKINSDCMDPAEIGQNPAARSREKTTAWRSEDLPRPDWPKRTVRVLRSAAAQPRNHG
jgi:hypothetical protein